jgi:hypothetical protein
MPGCHQTASWTDETIRPPEVKQVFSTSLFGGKPLLKSKKCLGKVFHPSTLRVVARGVKCELFALLTIWEDWPAAIERKKNR